MGAEDLARAADVVMDDQPVDLEQRGSRQRDVLVLDVGPCRCSRGDLLTGLDRVPARDRMTGRDLLERWRFRPRTGP